MSKRKDEPSAPVGGLAMLVDDFVYVVDPGNSELLQLHLLDLSTKAINQALNCIGSVGGACAISTHSSLPAAPQATAS